MLNYIKSELYRNIHSKGNYLFLIVPIILVAALNITLYLFLQVEAAFPYATTDFAFSSLSTSMFIPLLFTLPFVGLIQGGENKNHTLKNTVSFGISRNSIYLGKALVEIVISTIFYILISAAFIISGLLLLKNEGTTVALSDLLMALIGAYPLLLVGGMAAHFLYVIKENETQIFVLWSVIMFAIPLLLKMLGKRLDLCLSLYRLTPLGLICIQDIDKVNHVFLMSWSTGAGMIKCFLVGIIEAAIFYVIGFKIFEKKEIK